MWKYLKSEKKTIGTSYTVFLRKEDFQYLEKNLEEIIIESFNNAIIRGLQITINGKLVKPWLPKIAKPIAKNTKPGILKVEGKRLPYTFFLCEEEIPQERRNIEFHISGKKIITRKPKFYLDLKAEFQNKIYIVVDSMDISDQLKTDKVSFKSGFVHFHVFRGIDKEILKISKELGLLSEPKPSTYESNQLTKALDELFKDPEYSWLNPAAQKIITCGVPNTTKTSSETSHGDTRKNDPKGGSKKKTVMGLQIMWVFEKENPKDGWIDLATNRPAVNLEHALFVKVENNISARNYHVSKVVITALVNHGAQNRGLSVEEAFGIQTKVMTKVRDAIWC